MHRGLQVDIKSKFPIGSEAKAVKLTDAAYKKHNLKVAAAPPLDHLFLTCLRHRRSITTAVLTTHRRSESNTVDLTNGVVVVVVTLSPTRASRPIPAVSHRLASFARSMHARAKCTLR